jgi:hypothetical protein
MPKDIPIPVEGETQPEFAMRFHAAMMDEMPDAEDRSRYCFRQWRDVMGDDPETKICRDRFPASQFDERRDIAIFDEHETPREKYGRDDLVAIIANQNKRIRSKVFCPLSDGHTSDQPGDKEPAVLGFCGPAMLGMTADVNGGPDKYSIWHTEYHMKEAAPVLAQKRGRSIETWRIDARGQFVPIKKRFFSPVAALGSTLPRLDLPSAKYSRDNFAGDSLERYAMPGPTNMSAPDEVKVGKGMRLDYGDEPTLDQDDMVQDEPDQDDMEHSEPDGDEAFPLGKDIKQVLEAVFAAIEASKSSGDDREIVRAVLTGLTNTDLWQKKLAELEQEGITGSSVPSIPIPIEPTMPQPGTTPGGMNMPGAGQQAGAAPGAPSAFGASKPQPPKPQDKGSKPMSEEKPKYSNSASALQALTDAHAKIELLETAMKDMADQLTAEREHRVEYSRRNTLNTLATEYEKVDVDKLLAKCKGLSDADFSERVAEIKECYSRKPEAVRDYTSIAHVPDAKAEKDEYSRAQAVMAYAEQHKCDYFTARKAVVQD